MGNYLTQTGGTTPAGDLTKEVGNELLARLCPNGSGGVDVTLTERCIEEAESLIDGDLGAFYTVPFTPTVPAIIKTIALHFAVHALYLRRPEFTNQQGENPASKRYKFGMDQLDKIRENRPPLITGASNTPSMVGSLVTSDDARGFDPTES
jgi:phage gp36-like protein